MAVVLIDSYSESNASSYYEMYAGSNIKFGQSFTSGIIADITTCKFYMLKTGSPTGTFVATLYAHTGTYGTDSVPTGAALATSDSLNIANTLTTSYALVEFTFSTAYEMQASTYYVIVVEATFTASDSSNNIRIGVDNTSPTADGNTCLYVSSWAARNLRDTIFYVYGNEVQTPKSGFFMFF